MLNGINCVDKKTYNSDANDFRNYIKNTSIRESVVNVKNTCISEDLAATFLQKIWRGRNVRKKFSVSTISRYITHVCIKGNEKDFRKIGINGLIFSEKTKVKHVEYLRLDANKFNSSIIAKKEETINPKSITKEEVKEITKKNHSEFIVINGGFFNHKKNNRSDMPESTPIGLMKVQEEEFPSIEPSENYKDDYCVIEFGDGSVLSVAPLLSTQGNSCFGQGEMSKEKYTHDDSMNNKDVIPGELNHLAKHHPRAAISLPTEPSKGSVRLIVGLARNRYENPSSGYNIKEWAEITSRLDRITSPSNSSYNLDGGNSVAIRVVTNEKEFSILQDEKARSVANMICFSTKEKQDDPIASRQLNISD